MLLSSSGRVDEVLVDVALSSPLACDTAGFPFFFVCSGVVGRRCPRVRIKENESENLDFMYKILQTLFPAVPPRKPLRVHTHNVMTYLDDTNGRCCTARRALFSTLTTCVRECTHKKRTSSMLPARCIRSCHGLLQVRCTGFARQELGQKSAWRTFRSLEAPAHSTHFQPQPFSASHRQRTNSTMQNLGNLHPSPPHPGELILAHYACVIEGK